MGEKQRRDLKKHMILFIGAAVLLIVNLVFYSLGWFTFGNDTAANGALMFAEDCPFELISRGTPYEAASVPHGYKLLEAVGISDFGNLDGTLKNKTGEYFTGEGAEQERRFSHAINWLLSDESNLNNYTADEESEQYGLKPGAHGKLTFFISPNENKLPMTVLCDLGLSAYRAASGSNGETEYREIAAGDEAAKALDYLKGHILFFRKYELIDGNAETKVYKEPILIGDDGRLQFDVAVDAASLDANKEVRVDLYWVWPRTLPELLLDSSDPNLLGRQPLLADIPAEPHEALSDKENIAAEITENWGCFFSGADPDSDLIAALAGGGTYQKTEYIDLCAAYNQADQYIGLNVQFVVLELCCAVKQGG